MLVIDTNILLRCSLGNAMVRVAHLQNRGIDLAITDRNIEEFVEKLSTKFGYDAQSIELEVQKVIAPFHLVLAEEYEHLRPAADARLRAGGKSDWPVLAAAMALEADIWSEDVDFFGVGVPVWSSGNVQYIERGPV